MSNSSVTCCHSTDVTGITPDPHLAKESGMSRGMRHASPSCCSYPWQNKVEYVPHPRFYKTKQVAVKVKSSNYKTAAPASLLRPGASGRPAQGPPQKWAAMPWWLQQPSLPWQVGTGNCTFSSMRHLGAEESAEAGSGAEAITQRSNNDRTAASRSQPVGERYLHMGIWGKEQPEVQKPYSFFRDRKMWCRLFFPGSLINDNYSFSIQSHYISVKK